MSYTVHLSAPDLGALEEEYVLDALRSGWAAPAGPAVDGFERDMAARVGVPHAVALNSGTAALHLALLEVGAGPGDTVLVPTLTFAATANAVVYTGAEPYFVDSEAATGNMDVDLLAEALRRCAREGRRVRAVLTVDLFGACADYERIDALCAEYGVPMIEDAAEALGSTYRGRPAGSFGRAAILSFNGNKVITTSGGGMLLTGDAELAARARYLAGQARQPVPHYEHTEVGYNYRLSNVLAALGRAQLCRLDAMIERRRNLRERYAKTFAPVDGVSLLGDADSGSNCWLTVMVVDAARAGWHAADLGRHLGDLGIETRPVWKPMHRQPVFADRPGLLDGTADRLFGTGLVLPSGSALDAGQSGRVLAGIDEFLAGPR